MPERQRRVRPLWTIARRLWGHMGPHRKLYVIGLALGIVDAICQTMIPMVFREVLNRLQTDSAGFMRDSFWPWLIGGTLLILLFFPAAFFFHTMVGISIARLTRDMRTSLYQHVQRLSADFFHRHKVGEITQRLNNDLDAVNSSLSVMMGLVWSGVLMIWALMLMSWIDWRLAGLFLGLMVAVTIWSRIFLPRLRSMSRDVRDAVGEVSATITEYVGLNDLIKSYASEDAADARIYHRSNTVRKKSEYMLWRQYVYTDVMQVLTRFAAPFALLFVGASLLTRGYLQLGDLVAFWGFWLIMGGAINSIVGTFTAIFAGMAAADRVFDFFDESPMIRPPAQPRTLDAVGGEIVFDHVTFNYPTERDQPVLQDVCLRVAPARRVAIVGPSGAGKSTIFQLLLRFYDPLGGRIMIDGVDLRELHLPWLRSNVGLVMQESVFFSGTIEENLRLGDEDATLEQMRLALVNANALDFIDAMPSGLKTVLGERGVRLSGGQKQRLSIARIFLKNPPILLFDEATSSLDSVSERQVQAAMDRLMAGRTTIIVAHRIATIQNADEILVLQGGKITETGSHDRLLQSSALYNELCTHQQLGSTLIAMNTGRNNAENRLRSR